ncbi:MAG: S9 family peptidase [Clostridia bacterium]|nr:S9 family peptidase [Clostridia bacterium]
MKRSVTFRDFDTRRMVSHAEYLPGTDELIYADSVWDEAANRRVGRIVLRQVQSGRETVVTDAPGCGNPLLSPDGKKLLYLAAAQGGRQLFVKPLNGEAAQLTSMRRGVMDPQWSPDGEWIVFTSFAADGEDEASLTSPAQQQADDPLAPVMITDFGYKFDGLGFARPEVMQLWVVPADGSKRPKRITSGASNFMHAAFAPDSRHVVCESNLFCDKANGIATDVLCVDVETCEITRVTEDKPVVSYPNPVRPIFTADGEHLIIGILDVEDQKKGTYPSCSLRRVPLGGGEMEKLSEKTPECYDNVQFAYNANCGSGLEKVRLSSDGKAVLFHAGYRGQGRIYRLELDGDRRPVPLTSGKYAYNGMGVPKDGHVLVARCETGRPETLCLMDEKTGGVRELFCPAEKLLEEAEVSAAEDFFFTTLDGKSEVHGFCLPPAHREDGKKYPCIVYVHGGPHPFYTYGFDLEMQAFAGAGFGVLYCNPRGSSGYGDEHRQLHYAFDGSAYTDILQFVSESCRRFDWIDPGRLGLTGGSYGGYMTNYAATRCSIFKAYVTQRSIANELIGYASSDMQGNSSEFSDFGAFMDHEIDRSVICGMEKVDAPFLILHGQDDLRCPVEGAHQLFVALKDSHPEDFPVKMVIYPHVSHNQPQESRQRAHYYQTMLGWFRKYL